MKLGIWTRDLRNYNLKELRESGFNSLFFPTQFFINEWKWEHSKEREPTHEEVAKQFKKKYEFAKSIGYTHFVVDGGWGLDEPKLYWKFICDEFMGYPDVDFCFDEPYLNLTERYGKTINEVRGYLEQRMAYTPNRWIFGEVTRNQHLPYVNSLTSYYNQIEHWKDFHIHAWVYGQLKFDGGLRYEAYAQRLKALGRDQVYLYQADIPKWGEPYTWLNTILKWLGLSEWFERERRFLFCKIFGEKNAQNT